MSATDELRRMLDERGVKWETDRSGFRVMWGKPVDEFHDTMQFKAVDNALPNGGLNVHICGFTPEQAIAATLGSCNCSDNCTNGERTGTCTADETDTMECVCDQVGRYGKRVTIHVMECSECGHTYEHVNGDYEFCPRCGRRIEEVDV